MVEDDNKYTGPLRPGDMAAANYALDLRAEFVTDPVIPATVVEIIDDDDTLRVTAAFAGHPELTEIGVFVIGLHGEQLDCVSVTYFEPEKGDYDNLPMAGASKGVFAALIEKHRHDLDMLRATVAHDRDIDLGLADPDYLAPTAHSNDVRTKPMNNQTAMHKRYWVIGRQREDDSGGGYKRHVGPLDLDTPGATLTFDLARLEHIYSSADDTEVPEPDWTTFDKISAVLGAPHVIRLGLRAQASEKLPGADAITVTNAHMYLGFATLERYGAAADVLMRPRS